MRYQSGVLGGREAQDEVFGKALDIAFDGFIRLACNSGIATGSLGIPSMRIVASVIAR
jgi:hypothetical protein